MEHQFRQLPADKSSGDQALSGVGVVPSAILW
uniref:Uncharacterized protein n=1 Tax=Anguilla anguilla TaxID=7936 RepID=A0A0E9QSX7_ANGAN